ncbi:MAG: cyclic peptide export ABC transporter, partial [Polyangiales bacterium]
PILRPVRRRLALAVAASLGSGVASMLLIALINRALSVPSAELVEVGLGFAACSVASLVARWVAEDAFARVGQDSLRVLRERLALRVSAAPLPALEREGAARLNAALGEDIHTIAHFLTVLPGMLMHAAMLLGCFVYLGVLSLRVLAFVAAFVVVGSYAYLRAERWSLQLMRRARAAEDRMFEHFRGLFGGAKELRLHAGRRRAFGAELARGIGEVRTLKLGGLRISVAASSTGSFLFFVVIGSVLFVLSAPLGLEREVVSGYALVFLYMMLPLESLLGAVPNFQLMQVASEHLAALLERLPEERAVVDDASDDVRTHARIALCGVTHSYRRDQEEGVFEVGPIDLELTPGSITFLVGGNGSGKTTLAKVLVGLYPPERGMLMRDGAPVGEAELAAYRGCFSAIFSDFHLFDTTYGIDPARVARLAPDILRTLQLEHKVEIRDGRFSTLALSQGQRKRLALAAAWLEDRPVYVFDEWAADQDPAYKDTFYRVLLPALKARGKAVFVITHDDHYFGLADRVLKLESGRLRALHAAGEVRPHRDAPRASMLPATIDPTA